MDIDIMDINILYPFINGYNPNKQELFGILNIVEGYC